MNSKNNEEYKELLLKIKNTLNELNNCIFNLELKFKSGFENIKKSTDCNEFVRKRCYKDGEYLSKDCIDCPYKNESKKYYMGGE